MRDKAQRADSEITASLDVDRRCNTATASWCASSPRSNFAFPSAMHAFRTIPRCFVRLIALPRNATLYSSSLIAGKRRQLRPKKRRQPTSRTLHQTSAAEIPPAEVDGSPADSTGKHPGKYRSHKRDSRSPRETLPESRHDVRSSDKKYTAARPSDKAQSAHPSDKHRCIACNSHKDQRGGASAASSEGVSSNVVNTAPRKNHDPIC